MPRKKTSTRTKLLTDQAVALADYAAKAFVAADDLQIKAKAVKPFPLDEDERATVAEFPALPANVKKKLAKENATFTVIDTATILMAMSESFLDAKPKQQIALLMIAKKLMDSLQATIVMPDGLPKAKKAKATDTVYQLKITLLGAKPPIWRRIQVKDCTLGKLHEHIQTAMGWSNSHLHQFHVGEQLYGDPELMQENFEEMEYLDSTTTKISDILPKKAKRFSFVYEYDFGDSWEHEVLFESVVPLDSKVKYPLCLEGARACPPNDAAVCGATPTSLRRSTTRSTSVTVSCSNGSGAGSILRTSIRLRRRRR
jgi:Plasmid pRiA4b ORF-3-like protein